MAVYPPAKRTIPGFLYVGGLGVIGGSFFRDDTKTSIYTALTGVGITFLGYAVEKLIYKPVYKKALKTESDINELKTELEKYTFN